MKKSNPQILLLVGVPGSGKSTFAKYFIRTEENWMRLCRDDFRMMQFTNSNLNSHEEKMITLMLDTSIETLLKNKTNVVIDATHCRANYLQHYIDRFNHLADISFKVFEEDKQVIAERCEKRYKNTGKLISPQTQNKFMNELAQLKQEFDFSIRPLVKQDEVKVAEQDLSLPKAIICDLDGTLALMNGRNPFEASHCDTDKLNTPVANILKTFAQEGYHILLVSGRENKFRDPTITFLTKHTIPYHQLWMRESKDFRKDAIVKREIFEREIKNKYFIEFVLDDRDQVVELWRKELKLPCFQVNYGDF